MWAPEQYSDVNKILKKLLSFTSSEAISPPDFITQPILCKELIGLSKQKLSNGLIVKTLIELKKRNLSGVENFIEVYEEVSKVQSISRLKEWTVILPYNNLLLKKKFNILDLEFQVINQRQFKNLVNYNEVLEKVSNSYKYRLEEFKLPDLFIRLQAKGTGIDSCWKNIHTKFTILQGVYDYGLTNHLWIQLLGQGAMTLFSHPEWLLIQDKDGKIDFDTFVIYGTAQTLNPNIRIKPAIALLNKVKQEVSANTTRSLIYDYLWLYAQAMEAVQKFNSFLNFWQLFETICQTEKQGGKTDEVIKRLKMIIEETKIFNFPLQGIYKSVCEKRNDLVHRGIDNIDNEDLSILKLLADKSIDWLLNVESELKTKEHLKEYFKLKTKSNIDKRVTIETIKHLDKSKSSKKPPNKFTL